MSAAPNPTVRLVNLTDHAVDFVEEATGRVVSVLPSGAVARVRIERDLVARVDVEGVSVPVYESLWGDVRGLPDAAPNTYFVVSSLVADAVPDRRDLVVPDSVVIDTDGRKLGTRGLRINRRFKPSDGK